MTELIGTVCACFVCFCGLTFPFFLIIVFTLRDYFDAKAEYYRAQVDRIKSRPAVGKLVIKK